MSSCWEIIYDSPLPVFGNKTGVPYLRASQESIEINCNGQMIRLEQDLKRGLGGVVWDCGMVMTDFLNQNPSLVHDKICVDLGCGTGVVGVCAGFLSPRQVILCDSVEYSVVYKNMTSVQELGTDCTFCLYDWGSESIPNELQVFSQSYPSEEYIDLLLGSDILYDIDCYPLLERTLTQLRFRQLIITYKRRHDEREREFLRHLEQFYDIQVLKLSEQDPCSNSNSSSQAGVHILLFTKKGDRIES